jgi:hypothetical protein
MLKPATKFEELVSKAQYAVCIVGNPQLSEYELLDFPLPDEPEFLERGLTFVGILALVEWVPCSALAMPLDPATITRLSGLFVERLRCAMEAYTRGDSVEWLDKLYRMPDSRDPRSWN